MNKIRAELENLKSQLLSSPKERLLCVSTTANINNPPFLIGSLRETETTVAGNIILRNSDFLNDIVKIFDGTVKYFLVDCEVKNELKNLESLMLSKIKKSKLFFYKPNDFTVDSLDVWATLLLGPSLKGKKIAIIGAGNIGSKIALKLCERSADVFLYDKDGKKTELIANALNVIKRNDSYVKKSKSGEEAAKNSDLILGCAPGIPVITSKMVREMNDGGKIIDVGNGTIKEEAVFAALKRGIEVLCLSGAGGYRGMIENWLYQKKVLEKKRMRNFNGARLIVPGVFGAKGDMLVDDVDNPERVIGICDGKGDLISGKDAGVIFENFISGIKDKKFALKLRKLYN